MLAPKAWSNFLAYTTAWLVLMGWIAGAVSSGYQSATLLQGIVVLVHPEYRPAPYHTVLILWAAMLFAVIINSTTGTTLARFEGVILVLHLACFFVILVPMVYYSPHNDPATVFTTFLNEGGWSSQPLSFFVGFPIIGASLLGADCAVHMSEEIQGASLVVPRALMSTIIINGTWPLP